MTHQPPSSSGPSPSSYQLGKYQLIQEIARGGMGVVYLARNIHLGTPVAIKVLLNPQSATFTSAQRFRQEARLASRLNHPNIVRVLDFDSQQGLEYFVMEYVEGNDLSKIIKQRGALPYREALMVLQPVAQAMHYAHELNIVHRDLKSANILITQAGNPMVTDFGVAKDLGDNLELTQDGAVVGSPSYLAPEQIQGKPVDRRVDIYALGVIFYELLTGQRPFRGGAPAMLFAKILQGNCPDPRELNPNLPVWVDKICRKAMAKDPDHRFATAGELAQAMAKGKTAVIDIDDSTRNVVPADEIDTSEIEMTPNRSSSRSGRRYQAQPTRPAYLIPVIVVMIVTFLAIVVLIINRKDPTPDQKKAVAKTKKKGKDSKTPPQSDSQKAQKQLLLLQAKKLLEQGDFYPAYLKAKQAQNLSPADEATHLLLARCLIGLRDYPLAKREYQKLNQLKSTPLARIVQGHVLMQDKKLKLALEVLQNLEKENFRHPDLSQALSMCYFEMKKFKLARRYIEQALLISPDHPDYFLQKLLLIMLEEGYEEFSNLCKLFLQKRPQATSILQIQVNFLNTIRQYKKAIPAFNNFIKVLEKRNRAGAIYPKRFKKFHMDALFHLGRAHCMIGQYRQAIPHLKRCDDLYQFVNSANLFWLGKCYRALGQLDKAEITYRQAIAKYNHIDIYFPLADLYTHQRKYSRALRLLEGALKKFTTPKDSQIHYFIGATLLKKSQETKNRQDIIKCRQAFVKFLELCPTDDHAKYRAQAKRIVKILAKFKQ